MSRQLSLAVAFFLLIGCNSEPKDDWQPAPKEIVITPYLTNEASGKYLNIIYENFSEDTVRKLKFDLIATTGSEVDTIEREIVLKRRFKPKDRHLVTRPVSEKPVTYDQVAVGKVWIVKE